MDRHGEAPDRIGERLPDVGITIDPNARQEAKYDEQRNLAAAMTAADNSGNTLNATALVKYRRIRM